jgi:hypothetical protein
VFESTDRLADWRRADAQFGGQSAFRDTLAGGVFTIGDPLAQHTVRLVTKGRDHRQLHGLGVHKLATLRSAI